MLYIVPGPVHVHYFGSSFVKFWRYLFKTCTNNGSRHYGISLLFWYKHLSSGELIYQEHLPSELVNGEGGGRVKDKGTGSRGVGNGRWEILTASPP